jgi:uncharacterized membrane protein YvbJ
MALIPCPECQHQVSTQAAACPQCGYPISEKSGISRFAQSDTGAKVAIAAGGWLIAPWVARMVAVIVVAIAAVFIFALSR